MPEVICDTVLPFLLNLILAFFGISFASFNVLNAIRYKEKHDRYLEIMEIITDMFDNMKLIKLDIKDSLETHEKLQAILVKYTGKCLPIINPKTYRLIEKYTLQEPQEIKLKNKELLSKEYASVISNMRSDLHLNTLEKITKFLMKIFQ